MIKIKIWGDITNKTSNVVENAISSLLDEKEPVVIILNSNGGILNDAIIICNLLNNLPNPIITVVMGKCQSAATLIFNCGKKRYIIEDSEYMIHQPFYSFSLPLNLYEVNEYKKKLSNSLKLFKKYYSNISIPKEKVDYAFKYGKDLYLDYKECLKYNIATDLFKSWNNLFYKESINIAEEKILLFEVADTLNQEE